MADIKAKFVVEGEKEFKSALADAKAEVKLYTAEQEAAATATDGAKTSTDSLKKAIEAQKTVINTYKARIEEMETALADSGASTDEVEAATRRLRTESAKAETQLNRMNAELEATEDAADDAADATGDEGLLGKLKNLGDASFSFNNIVTAFGNIKNAVSAALDMVKEFGAESQNVINQSFETGYSTEQIQRMQYAERMLGLDGMMSTAAGKVGAAMLDENKRDILAGYGVDLSGNAASAADSLFSLLSQEWQTSGGLSSSSQGLMKAVFGEDQWNKFNALIAQYGQFSEFAESANVLTDEELKAEAESNQRLLEAEDALNKALQDLVITLVETGAIDALCDIALFLAEAAGDIIAFIRKMIGTESGEESAGEIAERKGEEYAALAAEYSGEDQRVAQIKHIEKVLADPELQLTDADRAAYQKQLDELKLWVEVEPVLSTPTNEGGGFFSWLFGGSHASGIEEIPYDGYPAVLHRGEAVLTQSQAQRWRAGGDGIGSGISARDLANAVRGAMNGVSVNMDGEAVGNIVAATVSNRIFAGV